MDLNILRLTKVVGVDLEAAEVDWETIDVDQDGTDIDQKAAYEVVFMVEDKEANAWRDRQASLYSQEYF